MSKKEKLFRKVQRSPHNIQFHELETLLSQFGFEKVKTNAGSHMKWIHLEKNIEYGAPRKNPMKPVYIKRLVSVLETHFAF